jgi:hypothetical protein
MESLRWFIGAGLRSDAGRCRNRDFDDPRLRRPMAAFGFVLRSDAIAFERGSHL